MDIKGLLSKGDASQPDKPKEYSEAGHPNAIGYGKIADKVMARMASEGWL